MVRVFTVMLALVAVAGCVGPLGLTNRPYKLERDFEKHPRLSAEVKKGEGFVVYEGLPHQVKEQELFEKELKTKKTIEIDDFSFYAEPIEITEEDAQALLEMHASTENVSALKQDAPCGKFHPDFALVGTVNGKRSAIHFCFGCGEVLTIVGDEKMFSDMTQAGEDNLGGALWKYAKNRPPRQKERLW